MHKFFFLLWIEWIVRLIFSSIIYAAIASILVTLGIYIKQGINELTVPIIQALSDIAIFWFWILLNVTILLALFRMMKYIFNNCKNGYKLELLSCPSDLKQEIIKHIGYGDLVKVWRKWFMLMIWLVAAQMIVAVVVESLSGFSDFVFSWFSVYILYVFIAIAGYISFILLQTRCKKVRIARC